MRGYVRRLLRSTAKDIGPPGWDRHSGSGIIQAKAAFGRLGGYQPLRLADTARLRQLEEENRCLRDLSIDLVIERRTRQRPL
jgi:hypothetical protein